MKQLHVFHERGHSRSWYFTEGLPEEGTVMAVYLIDEGQIQKVKVEGIKAKIYGWTVPELKQMFKPILACCIVT